MKSHAVDFFEIMVDSRIKQVISLLWHLLYREIKEIIHTENDNNAIAGYSFLRVQESEEVATPMMCKARILNLLGLLIYTGQHPQASQVPEFLAVGTHVTESPCLS